MTKVAEIEQAVAELSAEDLAAFRTWFEAFEADRFEERIQRDALVGKLDWLAEEAEADYRTGAVREL